jgi:hypothetical protein
MTNKITADTIDYLLFEEAIDEILGEYYPGRFRWDFEEDDTYTLHERARQRVSDKHSGLCSSLVLNEYFRS